MEEKGKRRISKAESESLVLANDDLLEILIRLPDSRSVIRCSAVCKQWWSLINSSHYKQLKQSFSINLPYTFIFRHGVVVQPYDSISESLYEYFSENSKLLHGISSSSSKSDNNYLSFLPWENVCIFSSFRDLILFRPDTNCLDMQRLMICNPLTKQYLELPKPSYSLSDRDDRYIICGFILSENIQQNHQYNFKVIIHKCELGDNTVCRVATFCSETRNWTTSNFSLPFARVLNCNASVGCNGMVHYLEEDLVRGIVCRVVAFDPFKDSNHPTLCRFIDFPSDFVAEDQEEECTVVTVRLGAVRGQLRLSQLLIDERSFLKVWELNYNKEQDDDDDDDGYPWSWTLVHDVELRTQYNRITRKTMLYVVAFHPEDGDVVFLSRRFDGNIYRCDIGEKKNELVGKFPNHGNDIGPLKLHVYTLTHPIWPTPLHLFKSLRI